ncbi:MAG: retroviral-like aspartic protease family protein [candidate division NC10 bacterium]|nr:retroviral-like aspartic protease family protein [candidate division NC10 bacterium]
MKLVRLAVLLLVLWPFIASAAAVSPATSPTSGLLVGRVVVQDQRHGRPQPWSRISVIWQGPSGQTIRAEADHDALFLLANLEPGEYTLTRLVLVRQTAIRGHSGTESLSLSLPSPWRVKVPPGFALAIGELAAKIQADRTVGMSVAPLSPSVHGLVVERLAGTWWAERLQVIHEPPTERPGVGEIVQGGRPQVSGPDSAILPYRGAGRSLVVEASLNGRRAGRFLLDTGASVTVISRRLAQEAGADVNPDAPRITLHTANGPVQAPLTTVASLRVGGLEVSHVLVAIHDLPGVNREIDGLLGMSFLRHFRVTIDPDRGALTLDRR